jgi:hypothetical protein
MTQETRSIPSRIAGKHEGVEKISCLCPYCHAGNRIFPEDAANAECFTCRRRFRVLTTRDGRIDTVRQIPEPLFLPKGSIRALTTLEMAGACWLLVYRGLPVPGFLLGLLLAMVGYYFGFRKGGAAALPVLAEASKGDVPRAAAEPLHLPGGSIRFLLIGGFLLSALWLAGQKRLLEPEFLEFYAVFAGLVVGQVFGRIMTRYEGSAGAIALNHAKGALVLLASSALALLLLAGESLGVGPWPLLGLACVISFYFGSK